MSTSDTFVFQCSAFTCIRVFLLFLQWKMWVLVPHPCCGDGSWSCRAGWSCCTETMWTMPCTCGEPLSSLYRDKKKWLTSGGVHLLMYFSIFFSCHSYLTTLIWQLQLLYKSKHMKSLSRWNHLFITQWTEVTFQVKCFSVPASETFPLNNVNYCNVVVIMSKSGRGKHWEGVSVAGGATAETNRRRFKTQPFPNFMSTLTLPLWGITQWNVNTRLDSVCVTLSEDMWLPSAINVQTST